MSLITPAFGLFFWMVLAFGLLLIILKKFAWKPILGGLSAREAKIAEALDKAQAAQEEVARLHVQNAQMAQQAQQERERMVAEAKEMREKILAQAQEEARKQAETYMATARQNIAHEEAELRRQLREEVVQLTVKTSERILREHFSKTEAQKEHVGKLLDEILARKA